MVCPIRPHPRLFRFASELAKITSIILELSVFKSTLYLCMKVNLLKINDDEKETLFFHGNSRQYIY